jgi:hypothetical protein
VANFQIYQKKPKVQNQDLIELGFFEEPEKSPRKVKRTNTYGGSKIEFKKMAEQSRKEPFENLKKSMVEPLELKKLDSVKPLELKKIESVKIEPKKPKSEEIQKSPAKSRKPKKLIITTPERDSEVRTSQVIPETKTPKKYNPDFESSDKRPKNLFLEESKK